MNNLIGKNCLIRYLNSFEKDIHIITDIHPTHKTMVYLDNNFDSIYHYERGLYVSDDIQNLKEILSLQKTYKKEKEILQHNIKCLESDYMKKLKELLN